MTELNPIETVYMVFIDANNRVLMHERKKGYGTGLYCIPGGHIDPDDHGDPIACFLRETREELGDDIHVTPDSLALYHTQLRLSSDSDKIRLNYFYVTRTWTGMFSNPEPDKAGDPEWFSLDNLPYNRMTSDVAVALKAAQNNQHFSIDGFPEGDNRGLNWLHNKQSC